MGLESPMHRSLFRIDSLLLMTKYSNFTPLDGLTVKSICDGTIIGFLLGEVEGINNGELDRILFGWKGGEAVSLTVPDSLYRRWQERWVITWFRRRR